MALYKSYPKSGKTCKVTFELPAEASAGVKKVCLVGDFNNWDTTSQCARPQQGRSFSITVTLQQGREYESVSHGRRTLENDWAADRYTQSTYGNCDNSVVIV